MKKIRTRFLRQEINYNELQEFEESTPEKSLWRFVAVDRGWGYRFVKTAYQRKLRLFDMVNNDNVIRMINGYLKFYKEVLTKFDIDVVLPALGMQSMSCPILEQLCKNMGIHYLLPVSLRTLNYMTITPNRKYTFPHINRTYRELIEGKIELDCSKGEECYQTLMASLNDSVYFDRPRIAHLNKPMPRLRFLVGSVKAIISQTLRWYNRGSGYYNGKEIIIGQARDLETLFSNISYAIRRRYQIIELFNPEFYSKFDPHQKYVYLPLQNTPEYSTQVRAPMWINQLVIIEALAKSVPVGWKLYVREHPGTLLYRVRELSFYREIKSYSNVDLIPTYIDNDEVLKNAQLVVTTAGTSGWEAVQWGKPVISLAENIYDEMGLSTKCTDLEDLSLVIHDEIRRIKQISPEERKRRMVCFLTAAIRHAFWVDNPLHVSGDAECTEQEAEKLGKVIGDKIKDYLDEYSKV